MGTIRRVQRTRTTRAVRPGSPPVGASAGGVAGSSEPRDDNIVATLRLADGSIASIIYTSLGDAAMPKERVEVAGEAGAGVLDDFRRLDLHRAGATETSKGRRIMLVVETRPRWSPLHLQSPPIRAARTSKAARPG